jgi:hypothetical protein
MKKIVLTILLSTTALSGFAQGTVIFNNRLGSTTHVYGGGATTIRGNAANDAPAGTTSYAGLTLIGGNGFTGQWGAGTTFAQLLAANGANQAESSLLPAAGITTFRTGAAAGNIAQVTATLAGVPADAPVATLQMVAWDNSSGLYPTWTQASLAWAQGLIAAGRSATFNVNAIGGQANPAPTLDNLTSFNIPLPEPTSFALAGLGAAALLMLRLCRKDSN